MTDGGNNSTFATRARLARHCIVLKKLAI